MKAKRQTGIWIDASKAILITLENGKEKIKELHSNVETPENHETEGDKGHFVGRQHVGTVKVLMNVTNISCTTILKQ